MYERHEKKQSRAQPLRREEAALEHVKVRVGV